MATRKSSKPTPARKKVLKPIKSVKPAKSSKPVPALKPIAAKSNRVPAKAKPQLVRDSFKMPKNEYVLIDELKQRALRLGRAAKKSEVLRAGVNALYWMSDAELVVALAKVPSLKTGRPKDEPKPARKKV